MAELDTKKGNAQQIVTPISVTTGVEIGNYIRDNIPLTKLLKGFTFNIIPTQTPGWWSGQLFCDSQTWATGATCWGYYMNRDTDIWYKYRSIYGGADTVTPFSPFKNADINYRYEGAQIQTIVKTGTYAYICIAYQVQNVHPVVNGVTQGTTTGQDGCLAFGQSQLYSWDVHLLQLKVGDTIRSYNNSSYIIELLKS